MLLSFCHNCHPFYLGKQITPPVLTDRGPSRPGEQKTALVLTEGNFPAAGTSQNQTERKNHFCFRINGITIRISV